ncbi:hypothetical protein [Paenibacillus sp. 1P07SE]|uniref:hypothetical protein n=1 Tax=Paenibacillus sp. 1P07SE TaxID=3132209 RepID=UPI0039A57134
MKLIHQFHLSFALLLLVVLSATGIIIHYVLLDHFVGTQKKEMQAVGQFLSTTMGTNELLKYGSTGHALPLATTSPMPIEAIISDHNGNIILGEQMLQGGMVESGVPGLEVSKTVNLQSVWDGSDDRFLVEVSQVPQGTLTLLTPMNEIKTIEKALLQRFMIVLCLAGALVFVLSLIITRRLIRPLMRLQDELKKVKQRKFAHVRRVEAGGDRHHCPIRLRARRGVEPL